jgi:hypothetical protein
VKIGYFPEFMGDPDDFPAFEGDFMAGKEAELLPEER